MKTSRLALGLLAVGITSLLGCGVTLQELHERNPRAATLKVHCRPWKIPEKVKLFAYRENGNHLASDERPDVLIEFAPHASVFIEVDKSAPKENARVDLNAVELNAGQNLQRCQIESARGDFHAAPLARVARCAEFCLRWGAALA
jgi:hypothetical protein